MQTSVCDGSQRVISSAQNDPLITKYTVTCYLMRNAVGGGFTNQLNSITRRHGRMNMEQTAFLL